MTVEFGTLLGAVGLLVGIYVGKFDIRRGQRETLAADVKASEPISNHFKEIAGNIAKHEIRAHGLETIGLRVDALRDRFDRHEENVKEQFADMKHAMENGLAARIALQVFDMFADEKPVDDNVPGPKLPVRKTRKRAGEP
jgi:hypothetical protein